MLDEITRSAEHLLRALVALDTSPSGDDHLRCVEWLTDQLIKLGFDVQATSPDRGPPALVATRHGSPSAGNLLMYGHYDVDEPSLPRAQANNAFELRAHNGRWMGRGVADNKGALACRLAALPHLSSVPGVVWLLQGEEETGSQVARHQFPRWLKGIEADVWLDENGYHDQARGSLRLISCRIARTGLPSAPDARLTELLANLEAGALLRGRVVERAVRRLNKALVPGGCAFQDNLPNGARYLALGVNDTASRIHTPEESVPQWAFAEHVQQLKVLWRWLSPPERAT